MEEKHPQSFDVCITCALPEEARAFLEVVRQQCEGAIEERTNPRYRYSYRFARIKNNKDEFLNLHISWLPRYGPQEMTLHLSRVLEECQPRIAIMTGICAGDAQHVQLGDLVVAERTFTYDNGKFTLDEQGRSVHQHDTLTYQLDANILQFLGLFDEWKPLVARLKHPPYPSEQHKRRKIACHIKAMASGSAVRADNPFEDVQAPVRGTVAIDMEGASFGLVMNGHPLTRWLVVKGVCDYADRTKSDVYHDYAARASALYALSFIRAYVTNEQLPRPDGPLPSSQAGPYKIWNVPHARNPHFTGRKAVLQSLRRALVPGAKTTALTQTISGLGGIGKTQVAIEYTHHYADSYEAVLWAQADSQEILTAAYLQLATQVLGLPEQHEAEKQVEAVKRWLQNHRGWLLILDNVEKPQDMLPAFLPSKHQGSVLITTRLRDVGTLARREVLPVLSEEEAVLFLLRRSEKITQRAGITEATAKDVRLAKDLCTLMGWLPLALDQIGAYLVENGCSLQRYTDLYRLSRQRLLDRRGTTDHPDSVLMTFWLSWEEIQKQNALAGKALQFCAFLAPDQIPEWLVLGGITRMEAGETRDALEMEEALGLLHRYSLIERTGQRLSMHRLVQEVMQEALSEEERQQWMERAVLVVSAIFPSGEHGTWSLCEFLLPHALTCTKWVDVLRQKQPQGGILLGLIGKYLYERAQYGDAEPLLKRALLSKEQHLGAAHPDTATSLNNLAALYHAQGRYEDAESLYQRALQISEQHLGVAHPDTATSLNNLAELYRDQGRYEEAEPLLKRALLSKEQHLGAAHPDTAISLNNLAELYRDQDRYEEAEPLYQQALQISEQHLGAEHPNTATSLNNLALLYRAQGRYEDAGPLLKRALQISEQHLGVAHPQTAASLNNLAGLYHAQGRYEEAEPLYQQALQISEQHLGAEHPNTATSLNNLALLYWDQGRYEDAESLYQRALLIREQHLGAAHPDTATSLNNLAELYRAQGRYEDAGPLLKRALQIFDGHFGVAHPQTAASLNNLAALYHAQGRYEDAEPLYQRALQISEQHLGAGHPNTAASLNNLALLYWDQGRYEDAEPFLKRALELSIASLGIKHPQAERVKINYLILLSHIYTGGDLETLLRVLAQSELDDDIDEGAV